MRACRVHLHLDGRGPADAFGGQLAQHRLRELHVIEVQDGRQQVLALHDDVEAVAQLLRLLIALLPHLERRLPARAQAAGVCDALHGAPSLVATPIQPSAPHRRQSCLMPAPS